MNNRITIADIAKELKTTTATVSRALSNSPEVSLQTKKMVRATAERLNYHPNKIAASLRSGKTKVIGVLIPSAGHAFFGSVISGISNMATKKGYDILIYQSNESQQFEQQGMQTFISARVDGILASIAKDTTDYAHFLEARERKIPIAFFDRVNNSLGIPSVCIDDYKGTYLATETLIRQGFQKIAHLSGPLHIEIFRERLRGYRDALNANGLPIKDEWLFKGDVTIEAGKEGTEYLLSLPDRPDAIMCVEDFSALGALKELERQQIKVPEDMGIFGFCNVLFGEYITPSLSTVDQQTVLMGEESFEMIHELIENEGREISIQRKVLDPILVLRESSQKKIISNYSVSEHLNLLMEEPKFKTILHPDCQLQNNS